MKNERLIIFRKRDKKKTFTSIVVVNGSGHFVAMNSVRDLFLEFQECKGERNSEEGVWGGGGVGG